MIRVCVVCQSSFTFKIPDQVAKRIGSKFSVSMFRSQCVQIIRVMRVVLSFFQEAVGDTLEELWISYNLIEKLKGINVLKKLRVCMGYILFWLLNRKSEKMPATAPSYHDAFVCIREMDTVDTFSAISYKDDHQGPVVQS